MSNQIESKIITIKGKDKIHNSKNLFSVSLPGHFAQRIVKLDLISFALENSHYNIVNGENNVLSISTDVDLIQDIVLKEGFYSSSQLISELQTKINAVITNTVIVSKDPLNHRLVFTINIGSITLYRNANTTVHEIMGLNADLTGATFTLQQIPNLTGINSYNIVFRNALYGNSVDSSDSIGSVFSNVPAGDFPQMSIFHNNSDTLHSVTFREPANLSTINIVLQNGQNSKDINIPDSSNLVIVFKAYHL